MEENIIKIKENNINIKICQKNNFLRNLKALLSVSYLKLLSSFFAAKTRSITSTLIINWMNKQNRLGKQMTTNIKCCPKLVS